MTLTYNVTFVPGRYKFGLSKQPGLNQPTYIIGREDDGTIVGFCFEENAAKQICFSMNLADAYIRGDTDVRLSLTRSLEGLKSQH